MDRLKPLKSNLKVLAAFPSAWWKFCLLKASSKFTQAKMLLNGRHEIYENSETVSSFTDVPFPHRHKKRPPVHWCKQRKKKGKQNGRGHWRGWLQYKQLLYIWSNSKVLLFFPDTLVYIQGEKPYLRFHCHCALWVMSCPPCPRLDPQADQGSWACTALKLYNYQVFLMISAAHAIAVNIDLKHLII